MKPKACDLTLIQHGMIAHGVNCQGKMGAGLAKAIKKTYPIAFQYYKEFCDGYRPDPSRLLGCGHVVNVTPICHDQPIFVANCFTQVNYGRRGKFACPSAIESSLRQVLPYAKAWGLPFYMPPIGCGLGGLDWETEVKPVVLQVERVVGWPITIATLDGSIE